MVRLWSPSHRLCRWMLPLLLGLHRRRQILRWWRPGRSILQDDLSQEIQWPKRWWLFKSNYVFLPGLEQAYGPKRPTSACEASWQGQSEASPHQKKMRYHQRRSSSWPSRTNHMKRSLVPMIPKHCELVLGSKAGDVVVFDETNMGQPRGISKAATTKKTHHKSNKIQRDCIVKRLPARTFHRPASCLRRPAASSSTSARKRPAAVMKSIYNRGIAGTSKDQRTGRWLFAAVLVGNKATRYTHDNGCKRFSFHIMDLPKTAPDGKPRGIKSMKKAILKCISPKAFVVHDKWKASSPALADIGFKSAPPVNHSQGWRDRATGFHSNDIESKFSRLKRYVRERYGRLSFQCQGADDAEETDAVDAGDLYEYTFKTNVGNSFFDVLKALQIKSPC